MTTILVLGLCCLVPLLFGLAVMLLFSVKILAVAGMFALHHYAAIKMGVKVVRYIRDNVTVDDTTL